MHRLLIKKEAPSGGKSASQNVGRGKEETCATKCNTQQVGQIDGLLVPVRKEHTFVLYTATH